MIKNVSAQDVTENYDRIKSEIRNLLIAELRLINPVIPDAALAKPDNDERFNNDRSISL